MWHIVAPPAGSTGRIRPSNCGKMRFSSQARSIAPCRESRRSIKRVPCSNSRTVMTERNADSASKASDHALSFGFGCPRRPLFATRTRRLCRADTSRESRPGEIVRPLRRGGSKSTWSAFGIARASERVILLAFKFLKFLDGQKHGRRPRSVMNRAFLRCALGAA